MFSLCQFYAPFWLLTLASTDGSIAKPMCLKCCDGRRWRQLSVLVFIFFLLPAHSLWSAELTLDFEAFLDETSLSTQVKGLTFTHATVLTSTGTLFADEFPPLSGVAVAMDRGGPISIDINLFSFGAIAISGIKGSFTYASPVTIEAFGIGGISLGSTTSALPGNYISSGNPPNELLELIAPDIRSLVITGGSLGDSFVLDDLTFSYEPSLTAIPEPKTWIGILSAILLVQSRSVRRLLRLRTARS